MIGNFTHSFTHLFTIIQSLTRSLAHSPSHSLAHSLIYLPCVRVHMRRFQTDSNHSGGARTSFHFIVRDWESGDVRTNEFRRFQTDSNHNGDAQTSFHFIVRDWESGDARREPLRRFQTDSSHSGDARFHRSFVYFIVRSRREPHASFASSRCVDFRQIRAIVGTHDFIVRSFILSFVHEESRITRRSLIFLKSKTPRWQKQKQEQGRTNDAVSFQIFFSYKKGTALFNGQDLEQLLHY